MSELILIEVIKLPSGIKAFNIEGTPGMTAHEALEYLETSRQIVRQGRSVFVKSNGTLAYDLVPLDEALKPTIINLNDMQL